MVLGCSFVPNAIPRFCGLSRRWRRSTVCPQPGFWKQVEAGKIPLPWGQSLESHPALDDAFIKEVAALPPEQQIVRVVAKLKELNPGYDGKEEHKIENGKVTELSFSARAVKDISPVRALTTLDKLSCRDPWPPAPTPASLADLSPLRGLRLTKVDCFHTDVSDLSPLAGMPLTQLNCAECPVSALTPLRGMPLQNLSCYGTKVSDLSLLAGAPLQRLHFNGTSVSDLSPLRGMPLAVLECSGTKVQDLSPLKDAR